MDIFHTQNSQREKERESEMTLILKLEIKLLSDEKKKRE